MPPRPRPSRRRPILRFRADGTFTIVQLTDVHWTDGEEPDLRARALIEAVLDAEKPDLVVLTGDIVEGSAAHDPAEACRQAVAPIEARGLPWAAVFGNHDDEGPLSREQLLAVLRSSPHCLAERGPQNLTGIGNYALRVASTSSGSLAAALYFLDSNAYDARGLGDYAWIGHDQIGWYRRTSRRLAAQYAAVTAEQPLPALAFFHIPFPEYEEVWRSRTCRGHRGEPVCGPPLNSGFFTALVEAGDVVGTFAGHDHLNDFEGELHGIRLCYGRATGYSGYGAEGFPRGARVVRLTEASRVFETWIRLDDGSVVTDPPVHEPEAT
jgi:3',5'-cyclic AMP phosphodiesterase CpdA